MSASPSSIASRAVGAGAWTVGTRLTTKLIDLSMLLCLARFLGPAEFGLVAMAMALVLIVEALFELPMVAALIRVPALTPGMLDTAFTLSLLRGLAIAALVLMLSWPLAAFNNEPRLKALVAVLALAPAMRGLVSPRMVEYARAFNFRPDAVLELSGKAFAFTVSVAIAVTTRSYWAIAAATVSAPLVGTLLSYCIAPMRPRLTLCEWSRFSSLIGWNFVSQLCSALNWQIDRLLLPRLTTATEFGQYAMGRQIAEIPMQALIQPLIRPAMSALASVGESRSSRYLQLTRAVSLVMTPVLGLLSLWPEVLVRTALGPNWLPAAPWLRWISAAAFLGLPAILLGPLAMTLDRARWLAMQAFVELLLRLPIVWLGAVRYGIPGAIAGSAIASAFTMMTGQWIVRRLIGISVSAQLMTLARPLAALLPAALVLWLTKPMVTAAANLPELLLRAVPLGLSYLFVYGLSVLLAWRLAGRPAGLEQHLLETIGHRFKRLRTMASQRIAPRPAGADDTLEATMSSHVSVSHPRALGSAMPRLVINGKFLQPATSRSGVYRVARELLVALDQLLENNPRLAGAVPCRVVMPGREDCGLRLSRIRVETDPNPRQASPLVHRISGVLWEQWVLPRRAIGDTLISLCNIGPILHRDAFTMVHDAQVYTSPGSYSRAFRTWYRFVLPRLGKRNKALLTVSEYSRRQLEQYGVTDAARINVIHDGCDHVLRLVPDSSKVESAGLATSRFVVALANTQPHKNIPVLLKAFHAPELREVTLALFGPAKREDFESQGHKIPSNVKFLGFVSDEQLVGLLQQATALAFPSTTEGFGLPPLEAMALGCPTVVAPCGALPEVCGDAPLWADAQDPAEWARQISRLCNGDDLREEMQRRGRAHAARFTWETSARRLLEIVLGQPLAETGLMRPYSRADRMPPSSPVAGASSSAARAASPS
jgi:O-antigen/teichoic acid export membrane protein/glycosyltransferase involved in cell wall biosynthesis